MIRWIRWPSLIDIRAQIWGKNPKRRKAKQTACRRSPCFFSALRRRRISSAASIPGNPSADLDISDRQWTIGCHNWSKQTLEKPLSSSSFLIKIENFLLISLFFPPLHHHSSSSCCRSCCFTAFLKRKFCRTPSSFH